MEGDQSFKCDVQITAFYSKVESSSLVLDKMKGNLGSPLILAEHENLSKWQ